MTAPHSIHQAVALVMPAVGNEGELRRVLRTQIDTLMAETPDSDRRFVLERLECALLFRHSRNRIMAGVREGLLGDETVLAIEAEVQAAANRWRVSR